MSAGPYSNLEATVGTIRALHIAVVLNQTAARTSRGSAAHGQEQQPRGTEVQI